MTAQLTTEQAAHTLRRIHQHVMTVPAQLTDDLELRQKIEGALNEALDSTLKQFGAAQDDGAVDAGEADADA